MPELPNDNEIEDKVDNLFIEMYKRGLEDETAICGCFLCHEKLKTLNCKTSDKIIHKDFIIKNGKAICCDCLDS